MDLADAVDVDDGGAVDAEEVAAVELRFDLLHGLTQQVRGGAGVQRHVVVGGFDPVDLRGVEDDRFLARWDQEARPRHFAFGEQFGDAVIDLALYLVLDPQGHDRHEGAGFGIAGWNADQSQGSLLRIESVGNGLYTIGSVQYSNIYLRMDGNGVTRPLPDGVGVANLQAGAGAWEQMYIVAA